MGEEPAREGGILLSDLWKQSGGPPLAEETALQNDGIWEV